MFPLFADQVRCLAASQPERTALLAVDGNAISYAELWRRVTSVQAEMRTLGLRRGDRVIVAAARNFDFVYTYLALHTLGLTAVPLAPQIPSAHFDFIRQLVRPGLILWPEGCMEGSRDFFSSDSADENGNVQNTQPDIVPSALADIMFTSGTTGEPKGVGLTHANIACSVNNINSYIGNTSDDVEICPMPLSHSFGLARLRCVLYAGGAIVLEEGVNNPRRLFETMRRLHVTGIGIVGPAWSMLHKLSGDRIASFSEQLRYLELGSAPLPEETKRHLAELLPRTRVCMHYGLTEASRAAFLDFHADAHRLQSVGRASPLAEIAIFDQESHECSLGTPGEVCVRGDMVSSGYLNMDSTAFFNPRGFFRTGDLGSMDAEGYLYLHGRIKEQINVGGEKVSPLEVETLLLSFPGIREAACVGQPDPVLGETVVAFIVPDGSDEVVKSDEILSVMKQRLEGYKIPRRIIAIGQLPRTTSGKIKRNALKERL
jgi:AMP-dependent synthetase/ligase